MTAGARRPAGESGFSILELLVATSLVLVAMGAVFQALSPAHSAFRTLPEAADTQQRLRVAADVLARDIAAAGRGPSQGASLAPLIAACPSVLPFRRGRRNPDVAGVFKGDAITVLSVSAGAAQTTLAQALPAASATVRVNFGPGCPSGDASCGFKVGQDVLVFDDSGACDTYTVLAVGADALSLQHNSRNSPHVYLPNVTRITVGQSRTYYLKVDTEPPQLIQYDGAAGSDVPVVDHVVQLSFAYFGDPLPPRIVGIDPSGSPLKTTYGALPRAGTENCVFTSGPSGELISRMADLSGSGGAAPPGLVRLAADVLTDGPWCPDAGDPNRVDADLFRVRLVSVALRVEAAAVSLRGEVGSLFWRGGAADAIRGLVPDQEVHLDIAPRNLNVER